MGFAEILTLIFVVLKIFGVITWSWWIVLLPELIAIGLYGLVFILGLCGVGIGTKKVTKSINKHF